MDKTIEQIKNESIRRSVRLNRAAVRLLRDSAERGNVPERIINSALAAMAIADRQLAELVGDETI